MDEYEKYGPEPDGAGSAGMDPAPPAAPRDNPVVAEALDWARSILIAVVLAFIIKATIVQAYMIPTGSMKPTIMEGDRVFGNRFVYHIHKPERGDIIAFKPPDGVSENKIPFLKRVIAVEGDTLEVRDGFVYVNGKITDEPYVISHALDDDFGPVTVPEGNLFVMGDNRGNSYDSRLWRDHFLPAKNVQAKAFFRFWPPGRVGSLY